MNKFRSREIAAAVAALLGWMAAPNALAQVATATLPTVVVSASRHEQLIDDLPATVDVLDSQAMERGQVQDIRDVARDLPNVSVRHAPSRFALTGPANNTGREGNAGFDIRGMGGNRVLMLVDEIRMPHSYVFGGNAFGRDYEALDLVKRVEIVRGPASALYGSDGMGGLVNFVTLQPSDFLVDSHGQAQRHGGRVSAAWDGSNDGRSLAGTVAGRASDTLEWLVSAGAHRAREIDTMGTNDAPNIDRTRPNPQQDSQEAVLGKIVFRPHPGQRHAFTAEHVRRSSDVELLSSRARLPLAGTASQIASAVLDESASATSTRDRATWDGRFSLDAPVADALRAVIGWQRAQSRQLGYSDLNTSPDRVRDVSYAERTWQAGVQADKSFRFAGDVEHKLTYGVDLVRSTITNLYTGVTPLAPEVFPLKRFPDTRETTSAVYAQSAWTGPKWSVVPGVRLDHFSLDVLTQEGFYPPAKTPAKSMSGSALSPKVGVLYRATPGWTLFGNIAGGFRAPNANQINGYYENTGVQVVVVPNPDLKPEKSRSAEIGVRARFERASASLAVFGGRFTNLILDNVLIGGTGVAGDPQLFQTRNTEKARIEGFEVKGRIEAGSLAGGQLGVPFAYGQSHGVNLTTGKPLNSIDPSQLSMGLDWQWPAWDLRVDVRRRAAKNAADIDSPLLVKAPNTQFTIPGSTTLDISSQWKIRKDLRLTAAVVNVTNRKYWLWSDVQALAASSTATEAYTQPGRHARVSLVADF
jgi:hemoglobin/transferrin/lactoferrin receptor protein